MVIDALTIEENAYSGFSHQAAITFADLAALPAGLTGTFTIGQVVAEDCILRVAVVIDTLFAITGSTALTAGITTPAGTLVTATSIFSGQGFVLSTTDLESSSGNVVLTLTATGANLNLATAGQIRILYSKNSLAKFAKY